MDFVLWNEKSKSVIPVGITLRKAYLVYAFSRGLYINDDGYGEVVINDYDYISVDRYSFEKYGFKHLDMVYHIEKDIMVEVLDIQMNDIDQLNVCYVNEGNVLTRDDIKEFLSMSELRSNTINQILS